MDRIESIAIHPTAKDSGYSRNFVIKNLDVLLDVFSTSVALPIVDEIVMVVSCLSGI